MNYLSQSDIVTRMGFCVLLPCDTETLDGAGWEALSLGDPLPGCGRCGAGGSSDV